MALNGVFQRPYTVRDNNRFVKKRDDEEKSAAHTQGQEQSGKNTKSKGLQYSETERKTPYTNPNENRPSWQETRALIQSQAQNRLASAKNNVNENVSAHSDVFGQNSAYANRNSNINIAQILKDFKNTQAAIGTPDNLKEEVAGYIDLIEKQVKKDNPNIKLVKSNLKNAASILDNYISQTLNKESKVVENWVDAIFLQQVDFKYNESDINPQFLVKFPEGSTQEQPENVKPGKNIQDEVADNIVQKETKASTNIPENKELKSMFIQAKKLAYAKEPKKAIASFGQALQKAKEVGDNETASRIYYEVGKIYDSNDYYPQALKSYHLAIKDTEDNTLKTKAHFSMAQIYDDVNKIQPALDHYFVSIGYAGENDNFVAQSTSLTKMGNIYTDMYEQDALDYYLVAEDLAEQTDNAKIKGFVSSNMAVAYDKFGEPQEALKSYSKAVQHYTAAESPQKVAQNYLGAADIMVEYGNIAKAKGLLKKAQTFANQCENGELKNEISSKLASLS